MNEIIYGIRNVDGKVVSINDVPKSMSGLLCGCVCAACRKKLQACSLRGRVRPYFRHNSEYDSDKKSQCDPNIANETALHKLAKQIIQTEKRIRIPKKEISASEAGIKELPEEIKNRICSFVFQNSMDVYAETVELEKFLGTFKPDVFIKSKREELFVEIFVSHRVNDEKTNKAREYGTAMLEVDISSFVETPIAYNELRDIILNSEKHKKWVYYPITFDALRAAQKYYEIKIEEYKKAEEKDKRNTYEETTYLKNDIIEYKKYGSSQKKVDREDYPFYLEVKDKFNQMDEKVIDSKGNRWIKCNRCGSILRKNAFSKFNVDMNPNLGFCTFCCHKYKMF